MRFPLVGGGHSAWLPLDSADRVHASTERITLDVTIDYDPEEGFVLAYSAREDPSICDDLWFGSLSEAERAAEDMFAIGMKRWQTV